MSALAGTGTLGRFVLRRDRLRLALWTAGVAALVLVSASSVRTLYRTEEDLRRYAQLVRSNPAVIVTSGPGHGLDDPSIGAVLVNETSLWGCVALALMSIFLVVRHTRAEEETERSELIRARSVGRHAPTVATMVVAAAANVLIAAVIGTGLVALGYGTTGSVALAASFAAVGLVFVGVAAVTSQLVTTARGAIGLAVSVLAASFVARAAGDIGDGTLSWFSPIGWGQATRPFSGERWWPLALCVVVCGLGAVTALVLQSRRDLGGGFIAQRPGPATASRWLGHPVGLAVRLQRAQVVAWSTGLFLLGVVYGAVGRDAAELLEDQPGVEEFLTTMDEGASLSDSFFAVSFTILALIASGYAISAALRLRSEEAAGRAEPVLATPTSRWRWASSQVAVAAVGTAVVVAAGGLGVGVGYGVAVGDPSEVARLFAASLASLPAVLVLASVAVALFGTVPKAALAAWGGLALVVAVTLFAELLELPQWARNVSPFQHTPAVPAGELTVAPLLGLVAAAVALTATGLVAFRRRDVG